jgi:hypothetical protein
MERKIMPESLLKKCIVDLKNEDPVVDFSSMRRPTRAERNIDDPIRDMEDDFLVDEYGRCKFVIYKTVLFVISQLIVF